MACPNIPNHNGGIKIVWLVGMNQMIDLTNMELLPVDKEELKKELDKAVYEENYERAARIRDAINLPKPS
jgi:excinuclease UvrABC helicase subunit UvrB